MSMQIPKKRPVLFFRGIFIERAKVTEIISKYKTDEFNKLMNTSVDNSETYDAVPIEFRNKENWLQTTNLLCSTCSQPIIGQPIPLPSYIVHDEHAGECVYRGITSLHHSWTCASMYNTTFKDNNTTGYFALKHLHQSWKGLSMIIDIPTGLPHTDKQQYGGKLTTKQWDDMNEYLIKDSLNRAKNYQL
jgi:hypothetical protein